jgi:hypothetical protein
VNAMSHGIGTEGDTGGLGEETIGWNQGMSPFGTGLIFLRNCN